MAEDTNEGSPFTRPGFLISTAVVIGLVVMLVWLLARPGGGENDGEETTPPEESTTAPAAETPTESPSSDADATEASWCGLEAVELDGTLTRAPADIEWEYVGTIAVPALEGHGPGVVEDSGLPHCWAQTPEGAVLAATSVLAASASPDLVVEAHEELYVDGELRDRVLADPDCEAARVEAEGSGVRASMVGFRLLSYSGTAASVDVLLSTNQGEGYASFVTPLVWVDGDWQVEWRTQDEFLGDGGGVETTAGYVLWEQPS
jgi:hypothetical protein